MSLHKYNFRILIVMSLAQWIRAAHLRYYKSSIEDYKETELQNPLPLLDWIDLSKPTLFHAFGYSGSPDKEDVKIITNAFINKNDTNYILVNWELEANNKLLEPVLAHAITATPNSILIGKILGLSLLRLSCYMDMSTVQLSGHSLGAHLVGYAGSIARERGLIIRRITGLDPSSFRYEGYIHSKGLDSSSAAFVAIWHVDPSNYGTTHALGDVDICFNCQDTVQPGCPEDPYLYRYNDSRASCSHRHATYYFAEAVSNPQSFIAVRASSCESWSQNTSVPQDQGKNLLYINEKIDTSARGFYYLSTNAQHPYAKGLEGINPS